MCALEMVQIRETKEHFPTEAELGNRLTQAFSENGLILSRGNAINVAPPLCITRGEVDELVSAMDRGIGQTVRDLGVG